VTLARLSLISVLLLLVAGLTGCDARQDATTVRVGSKLFTESVILGEILTELATVEGVSPVHRKALGGTRLVFNALLQSELDAYVDYTGTLMLEIYSAEGMSDQSMLRDRLQQDGLGMLDPIGFNNTYGIAMRKQQAIDLGVRTISDLRDHPRIVLGSNNEYLERADGWRVLRDTYGLPQKTPRAMDHDLAYLALSRGELDAMIVYTTDAKIGSLDLIVLEDDLEHFPVYEAVVVYRLDLANKAPGVLERFTMLSGSIDATTMALMNDAVEAQGKSEARVAGEFVDALIGKSARTSQTNRHDETLQARLLQRTKEHMVLVALPVLFASILGIPLGVLAAHRPKLGHFVLGAVGVGQTVPALALLVLLIPFLAWIDGWAPLRVPALGATPAIIALTVYSLLPIVRTSHAGVINIEPLLLESARALGLSSRDRLLYVEFPLALPTVLVGIKTAAVISVGYATLGGFVDAGGYGAPIFAWIRTQDYELLLIGALPAVVMALVVQTGFDLGERMLIPAGLRLSE
jgi:osmoprotectant transport system permease protein